MTVKNKAPGKRYWRKWNLDYTKRVLSTNPTGDMARALLACWPPRIQQALRGRFSIPGGQS
ncbi:hypothetical protein DFO67_11535 [Modicisalibacter xianhensis]|uniref:Transposase n=1 Tax=Modicisalibacter xianhensis TaxID=442341 RepID=A0A4R8FKK1_9GAMM|nr:hypothetical protein DFO67_11535 [Halomonas xianhensis]